MEGSYRQADFLRARVRVPEHVVYRDFDDETVVLNLQSGSYHGLNATAALILRTLDDSQSVGAAIERLVEATGQAKELIERDAVRLCKRLQERDLIQCHEVDGDD